MSALSLRLPESVHRKVRELAERDDISINQFIATAVAEKMAALMTLDYLEERARHGSKDHLRSILRRVPDGPPLPGDEWPAASDAASHKRSRRAAARRRGKARRSKK